MATVVDALTVTLGLDNSQFTKGQEQTRAQLNATRQESVRVAKEMQASGAQAAQFFSQIKTEALSLLGVFMGGKGIESFVRDTTRSMSELAKSADLIGISVTDLNAFSAAIERMGGSADGAVTALRAMAAAKRDWNTYGTASQFNANLGFIGANPQMNPLQMIQAYAAKLKESQGNPAAYQNLIQRGQELHLGDDLISTLNRITEKSTLTEQMNVSREYLTVTKEMSDRFVSLQTGLSSLSQAMEGLATKILDPLVPSLDKLARRMAETIAHAPEEVKRVTDALAAQREFDQRNIPAPTGANAWINNLLNGGDGSLTSGSWWDYLFGNDMQQDRNRAAAGGATPRARQIGPQVTPGAGPRANSGDPRGIRNNNPLNLTYLPGQGAFASDGRFGVYSSMEAGVSANASQILSYRDRRGLNTVAGIVGRWAPPGENDTGAYTRSVAGAMGISPNAQLDLDNPEVMSALINAMSKVENGGRTPDPAAVQRGVRSALSANTRRRMTPQLAPGDTPALSGPGPALIHNPADFILPQTLPGQRANQDNSSSVTIGNINIHTQATDAKGVAGSLRDEIANQANRGAN